MMMVSGKAKDLTRKFSSYNPALVVSVSIEGATLTVTTVQGVDLLWIGSKAAARAGEIVEAIDRILDKNVDGAALAELQRSVHGEPPRP